MRGTDLPEKAEIGFGSDRRAARKKANPDTTLGNSHLTYSILRYKSADRIRPGFLNPGPASFETKHGY